MLTARLLISSLALLPWLHTASEPGSVPTPRAALSARGSWTLSPLPPAARGNVVADLAKVLPTARPVLDLVDGAVAIDADITACRGIGDSCSGPAAPSGATIWRIHLDATTVAGSTPSQRFLVYHEIGHAVWTLVLSADDRDAFVAAVQRSLAGQPCQRTDDSGPCAVTGEQFADEFARWAGGFKVSMSWYDTPALLSRGTFSALIESALAARGA